MTGEKDYKNNNFFNKIKNNNNSLFNINKKNS